MQKKWSSCVRVRAVNNNKSNKKTGLPYLPTNGVPSCHPEATDVLEQQPQEQQQLKERNGKDMTVGGEYDSLPRVARRHYSKDNDPKIPAASASVATSDKDCRRRPGRLKWDDYISGSESSGNTTGAHRGGLYPKLPKPGTSAKVGRVASVGGEDELPMLCAMMDRSDLTTCAETKSMSDSSNSLQVHLLDQSHSSLARSSGPPIIGSIRSLSTNQTSTSSLTMPGGNSSHKKKDRFSNGSAAAAPMDAASVHSARSRDRPLRPPKPSYRDSPSPPPQEDRRLRHQHEQEKNDRPPRWDRSAEWQSSGHGRGDGRGEYGGDGGGRPPIPAGDRSQEGSERGDRMQAGERYRPTVTEDRPRYREDERGRYEHWRHEEERYHMERRYHHPGRDYYRRRPDDDDDYYQYHGRRYDPRYDHRYHPAEDVWYYERYSYPERDGYGRPDDRRYDDHEYGRYEGPPRRRQGELYCDRRYGDRYAYEDSRYYRDVDGPRYDEDRYYSDRRFEHGGPRSERGYYDERGHRSHHDEDSPQDHHRPEDKDYHSDHWRSRETKSPDDGARPEADDGSPGPDCGKKDDVVSVRSKPGAYAEADDSSSKKKSATDSVYAVERRPGAYCLNGSGRNKDGKGEGKLKDDASYPSLPSGSHCETTSTTLKDDKTEASKDHASTEDTIYIEVFPGVTERLRRTKETKEAVAKDFYAPSTCFACSKEVFCIADVKYYICPDCKCVNPLTDERSDLNRSDVGIAFGFETLFKMQSEIVQDRGDIAPRTR